MNTQFQGYNVVTATQSVFRQYALFSGRATRSEYWWFQLASNFLVLAVNIIVGALSAQGADLSVLSSIVSLFLFLPLLSVSVRRMHDIGKSGWNLLWLLLPLVGTIIVLVYCCRDSQGDNQYGPSEKYPS